MYHLGTISISRQHSLLARTCKWCNLHTATTATQPPPNVHAPPMTPATHLNRHNWMYVCHLWSNAYGPVSKLNYYGVHFFFITQIYHTKCTNEPHCISWTDIDMGKTISTFLYYFLISFSTSFSTKHFICALHNSVAMVPSPLMAPIQKWNFLTLA